MTSIKLLMDRTVLQALAVSLVLSSFPAFAQTDVPASSASTEASDTENLSKSDELRVEEGPNKRSPTLAENGLYALCNIEPGGPASVCPLFLRQHFANQYDSLRRLIEGLDARKDQARDWAKADKRWLIGFQWGFAALGAVATIMISLNTVGRFDLRRWAVVPTAAIGFLSALSAFYDFGKSHNNNLLAQSVYAGILDNLQVELVLAVETGKAEVIDIEFIAEYRSRLDERVRLDMQEYMAFMKKRAAVQKEKFAQSNS